ncbi:MAG: trimethylamine methyltransferase family protein [Lachnospiraceae bacterium]|jgi:trimethylamine--corrinoid protein Co-methyltransferase
MLRTIKQSEIELIHEKTLHLLEHVGVVFEHDGIIEEFKKHGIRTDGYLVYFDRKTVETAVSTLKRSFVMKTPFEELKIGEGGIAFSSASGCRKVLRDGSMYDTTIADYVMTRKLDATSPIINLSSSPLMYVADFPEGKTDLIKAALTLKYSKHPAIMSCFGKKDAEETIALARDFYDTDEGYYTIGVGNVISPLYYNESDVEAILAYTKRNLPVVIACCSSPGMTSPITLSGTMIQNNAEVLAGVIMTQIVNPGAPVVYGNTTFTSNMRTAETVSWGPEVDVFIHYAKAMADFYGLPYRGGGSLSAAKDLDYENGAETALSLQATMDAGTDFIFHAFGELDGLNAFSLEKYVLDEELLASMLSVKDRDLFDDELLCIESMEEVGPRGNYLVEEETVEYYQEEVFYPTLFNIGAYNAWEAKGKPGVAEKAKAAVEKRLAGYELPEYSPKQKKILEDILQGIDEA